MITIKQQDSLINIAVFGEFTLADYKEFEQSVQSKIPSEDKVNLLFDLRDMLGFTVDVAWEEIKFSRQHEHEFGKVAVVTSDQWITWSTWLSHLFVDIDIKIFDEYETAQDWVMA